MNPIDPPERASEFFTPEADGTREDAALHAAIEPGHAGSVNADIEALALAVEAGVPMAAAADLYAGDGARLLLRRAGLVE